MHHMKFKAAVSKYAADFKAKGSDVVKLQMLEDGIAEADADEVIEALSTEEVKAPEVIEAVKPVEKAYSPNEAIKDKLAAFDYSNLKGESFAKYGELVQSLPQNQKFDFEVMQVKAIQKVRYKGVKDSPVDIIGVAIENNVPKMTTRVSNKTALTQNGSIVRDEDFFELVGQQFHQRGNGLFYFLKK